MSVASRVAIVTGAARGVGRAIALRLAGEGLAVVVNDLPSQAAALKSLIVEIHAMGRLSVAIFGDVSQEADVENLVRTTIVEFGGLDVMIANASIGPTSSLVSSEYALPSITTTSDCQAASVEQWDLVHSTNARSTFLCYKAAAIQMIKQGRGGRIIGACYVAGKQGFPEWGTYSASKFAVRGLTQSAAAELREHGITVNACTPGIVDTEIFKDIEEHRANQGLGNLVLDPGWKVSKPEDVAGLVAYLVANESQHVTGQAININGGMYCD